MGFFDKLRDFAFAGEEIMDEDYEFEQADNHHSSKVEDISSARERKKINAKVNEYAQYTPGAVANTYVKVTKPAVVSDATHITKCLKNNEICIVILDGIDNREAQRIADFLGGATYAIEGAIKRLSSTIFMVAPKNVNMSDEDLKEQLKSSGLTFPNMTSMFE